jgi:hypothetical protein
MLKVRDLMIVTCTWRCMYKESSLRGRMRAWMCTGPGIFRHRSLYGMLFMVVSKNPKSAGKNQFLASQVPRTSLVPDLQGLSSYTTIRRKHVLSVARSGLKKSSKGLPWF